MYNEKNKKKEAKPMDIDKVVNVSSEVMDAVVDAVNRNDFSDLSSTIQQKVAGGAQGDWQQFAEDEKRRNDEMRRRQDAQRQQQARQAEEARKPARERRPNSRPAMNSIRKTMRPVSRPLRRPGPTGLLTGPGRLTSRSRSDSTTAWAG